MATISFKFWEGYYNTLRKLPPEDGYRLVMAMCRTAFDEEGVEFEPGSALDLVWTPIQDQVAESARMSRDGSKGGKRSGETRRNKSANTVRKGVRKGVPNERKGTEVNGKETRSLRERGASRPSAVQARALAPDDDDDARWMGDTL